MDELELRALLHSTIENALTLAEAVEKGYPVHELDSMQPFLRQARTVNELVIDRLLKEKRETPADPLCQNASCGHPASLHHGGEECEGKAPGAGPKTCGCTWFDTIGDGA